MPSVRSPVAEEKLLKTPALRRKEWRVKKRAAFIMDSTNEIWQV